MQWFRRALRIQHPRLPLAVEAQRVVDRAIEEAHMFDQAYVGSEHLLLSLLQEEFTPVAQVLLELNLDYEHVHDLIELLLAAGSAAPCHADAAGFTQRANQVLHAASDEARRLNHPAVGAAHLLLGMTRVRHGMAAGVLAHFGLVPAEIRAHVLRRL